MDGKGVRGSQGKDQKKKAGYEYLLGYKITIPIYDYTVIFCSRCGGQFPPLSSKRTYDQMVQGARSGTQNIAEGNQQASLEGYIKLVGVNRASLEELLKDFLAYGRQNSIPILGEGKDSKGSRGSKGCMGNLEEDSDSP